jgi:DinB family protein
MDLRYPVGPFSADADVTPEKRKLWISQIAALPVELNAALAALPPGGLDRSYRDNGWTARQVVHHLADSHLNAHTRVRLALTEETPTIKTYEESEWAKLDDAIHADLAPSLSILEGLHQRFTILFNSLRPEQFARTATHPEFGAITVDWLLQMYSWHCRHHVGHIRQVR